MSDPLETPYDPKAAALALARERRNTPGRKLSFYDQCAAFYALYNGIQSRVVARAFGISETAASQIGGCLARDPRPYDVELVPEKRRVPIRGLDGKRAGGFEIVATGAMIEKRTLRDMNRNRWADRKVRYRRVADEFERLGEDEFAARYYPERISLHLAEIKHGLDIEAHARVRKGADPTPDGGPDYAYLPSGQRMDIAWRDEPNPPGPAGWYIVGPNRDFGSLHSTTGEQWPFKNQAAARKEIAGS